MGLEERSKARSLWQWITVLSAGGFAGYMLAAEKDPDAGLFEAIYGAMIAASVWLARDFIPAPTALLRDEGDKS